MIGGEENDKLMARQTAREYTATDAIDLKAENKKLRGEVMQLQLRLNVANSIINELKRTKQ